MVINPIVGVYIPIIRIPFKGGMTIPNIQHLIQEQVQAPVINQALRFLGHRLSLLQTLRIIAEVGREKGVMLAGDWGLEV